MERFIVASKGVLEASLSSVRNRLAEDGKDVEPSRVIELAYTVACGGAVRPVEQPLHHVVGQLLTLHNITYPVYGEEWVRYKPQLPIYCALLRAAVNRRASSILRVSVEEALRVAVEEAHRNQ